jgi:O-antigen ligase
VLGAPLAVIVALGGLVWIVPASVSERLDASSGQFRLFDAASIPITDENFAAAERMAHWQAGWAMFEDNMLLGVGVGNFNERYDDYFVREEFRFSRGHAHNYYIHTLAETGLAGLLAYLWLIVGLGLVAVRTVFVARHGFARLLALGVVGTMTAVSVHNFFENLHVLNLGINLSLIWALGIVAQLMAQREAQAPGAPVVPS